MGDTRAFFAGGYAGIRAAVFGASGFIGRWVARALSRHGAEVFAIVRDRQAAAGVFAEYGVEAEMLAADISRPGSPSEVLRQIRPAIAFNLAGYGVDRSERDPSAAHGLNAKLVESIAQAMAQHRANGWDGQHLVHTGSALEYGTSRGDLVETTVPAPTTLYGITKLAGTRLLAVKCQELGLRGLTARLFTVYGPGEHAGRLLPSLVHAAQTRQALPLTAGRQLRDFTFVEEAAEGLLRLGLSSALPGEVVNLATGELTSVRTFAETAARVLGIAPERMQFGALPTREEEMAHAAVAIGRLCELVDWHPRIGIELGIRRTVEKEQ